MPPKASRRNRPSPTSTRPSSSPSSPSPSSRFSSPLANPSPPPPDDDDGYSQVISSLLHSASLKFPSFLSNSALVARIVDVAPPSHAHSALVWLPPPAMASASILPGSLVSISLPASTNRSLSKSPLISFSEEYEKQLGVKLIHNTDHAGSSFALAVAYPSCKVVKNEVKLSWSLSCSMGHLTLGKMAFISPIQGQAWSGIDSSPTSDSAYLSSISLCKCSDLFLKLIHVDSMLAGCDRKSICVNRLDTNKSIFENGEASSAIPHASFSKSTVNYANTSNIDTIELAIEEDQNKGLMQSFLNYWLSSRPLLLGNLVCMPLCGQLCTFLVEKARELKLNSFSKGNDSTLSNHVDAALVVGPKTCIHMLPSTRKCMDNGEEKWPAVVKLGGLSKEMKIICEKIRHCEKYTGILVYGPPGTGKTSLIRSCAYEAGVKLFSVRGPEIITEDYGKSEEALIKVCNDARKEAPSVVFIDELDALAPVRKDGGEPLSQRMLSSLLNIMEEISASPVLLIAATNQPDSIDSSLRRHGRFDREIEIGAPSADQRLEILSVLLCEKKHSLAENEIKDLALRSHGFVGADLASLCNEAAFNALRRHIGSKNLPDLLEAFTRKPEDWDIDDDKLENRIDSLPCQLSNLSLSSKPEMRFNCDGNMMKNTGTLEYDLLNYYSSKSSWKEGGESLLSITMEDFENALKKVRPSAMREIMIEVPQTSWDDIGGQEEVKNQLKEVVEWPLKYCGHLNLMGIDLPLGVLMFGPPGCSKTLLARAVASNSGLNFLAVKGPELFSKWVGESEKSVKSLFKKAKSAAPSIIFFDEIDALASTRGKEKDGTSVGDRVLSQLLEELDGVESRGRVIVIAATNRPDKIDPALLRPGRFDRHLYVGLPSEADREAIFRIHLRRSPLGADISFKNLANLTEGCTGADIFSVCQTAGFIALEENMEGVVSMSHFISAIGRVKPTDVHLYEAFAAMFGRFVHSINS